MAMIRLLPVPSTFATATLTLAGNAADTETVTIGSVVYRFMDTPVAAYDVLVGATASDSCDNLIAAVNAAAGAGTLYFSAVQHPQVSAVAGTGDTVDFTARAPYEGPQIIATTETMGSGSFASTQMVNIGTTATNSPPTTATPGVALPHATDRATLLIQTLAASGTVTATFKLWGYNNRLATWFPLGIDATAANKGVINGGNAVAEGPISDVIRHAEEVTALRAFSRVYLEITAIGGTGTSVAAYLHCTPTSTASVG